MEELKHTIARGKTVDEAIFSGLKELNLSIDEVKINILEEGTKGIFGLGKSARVELSEKAPEIEEASSAQEFLQQLLNLMKIDAKVNSSEGERTIKAEIVGDNLGILIGRRGETLDALQYLTSLVVNNNSDSYKKVIVDTEDYRKKREITLVKLARRLASKVKKTGEPVVLEPMNPYERRILHSTLQNDAGITTHSEGDEPRRHVVIQLKRD